MDLIVKTKGVHTASTLGRLCTASTEASLAKAKLLPKASFLGLRLRKVNSRRTRSTRTAFASTIKHEAAS